MKKTLIFLMLFVMSIALCPKGVVFAEEIPGEEIETPELFDGTAQATAFDIGVVNLTEEPEPEPDSDDSQPE